MSRCIPQKLLEFVQSALHNIEDGVEYASELDRILNSPDCQNNLSDKEIEALRDFANRIRKVCHIDYYSKDKIREVEAEIFGTRGIIGYLQSHSNISICETSYQL